MNLPAKPSRTSGRLLTCVVAASVLSLAACSDDDPEPIDNADGTTTYSVNLAATQEVPPLTDLAASGTASITIDLNTGVVSGSVTGSDLTGPAQEAHIHQRVAGSSGGVLITFVASGIENTFNAPGEMNVLDAVGLAALANGELYLNMHTTENTGGEIRGQIIPEGVLFSQTELSGANERPNPVVSSGSARGITTVIESTGVITAAVFTNGLDTATDAHIHTGAVEETGSVLIPLVADAENPGVFRTGPDAMLDADGIAAFKAGGLYFNVHTTANPDGEVRGQL